MMRLLCLAVVATLVNGLCGAVRGQEAKDAAAIVDKSIKAIGGAEKLSKAKAIQWKAKAKFRFGENENEGTIEGTMQGLDHSRRVFEGQFGGNAFRGVTVIAGDKGWRKFGDNAMELDSEGLANEKRRLYLSLIPITVEPLKGKGFKLAAAGEEKIGGKPASGVKVTAPDAKTFTLYFDKESGLPAKLVAEVIGFNGDEYTQETTFTDYKEFDGVKVATKLEAKRDGQTFQEMTVTDFKLLDKVDPKTFAEPD
jgi:hypothetical protein